MKIKETITKAMSLGTGLAVGMLLIGMLCHEMSFDRCYSDAEDIWQIMSLYTMPDGNNESETTSGAVAPGFREYVPGVETATRWRYIWNSERFLDEDRNTVNGSAIVADTNFFDVFDTEIIAGDPKQALGSHGCAMVSESFAEKLGGTSEAIGKIIQNEELPGFMITVSGIFRDFPHHSSVEHDVLLSMESLTKQSTEN